MAGRIDPVGWRDAAAKLLEKSAEDAERRRMTSLNEGARQRSGGPNILRLSASSTVPKSGLSH
jgi:hypothetical protein